MNPETLGSVSSPFLGIVVFHFKFKIRATAKNSHSESSGLKAGGQQQCSAKVKQCQLE